MADDTVLSGQRLFLTRVAIGLVQGLVLYLLYQAQDGQVWTWPATNGLVFAPLLLCWLFIPLLANSASGEMRWQRATVWIVIAAIVLAILALCDNWSAWPEEWVFRTAASGGSRLRPHILPSVQLLFFGGAGLFIAHALVVGGHIHRRFRATYATHFDIAWKLAVQAVLGAAFVGAFWLMLVLGSGLFNLIKLDFFKRLIQHEWFAIPVTALAAAAALHLTDIRPALVRGARTLALGLLSWLLPLLTLIVAGFLASLPFTGLAPLWSVGHASALLLASSAALIILINAAHQDGESERLPPSILQMAGSIAAILPVPLSLLAAYALYLRVQQYGWSDDRVVVAACVLVAIAYAGGYVRAVWPRQPWLYRIEDWNFNVALLILVVLLALLTPIASPVRIAVADQMARLESGKIKPEKFDIAYLRRSGGRYGKQALERLSQSKSALLRESAVNELKTNGNVPLGLSPKSTLASRISVHPDGAKLPASFFANDWSKDPAEGERPACMTSINSRCEALMADIDGDGKLEIILFGTDQVDAQIFHEQTAGTWRLTGLLKFPYRCAKVLDGLRSGRFQLTPRDRPWNDLIMDGLRLHVADSIGLERDQACPK